MLLNRGELNGVRLLSPKTIAVMTSDQLPPGIPRLGYEDMAPTPDMGHSFGDVRGDDGADAVSTVRTLPAGDAGTGLWGIGALNPRADRGHWGVSDGRSMLCHYRGQARATNRGSAGATWARCLAFAVAREYTLNSL